MPISLPARVWIVTIGTAAGRSVLTCSACPSPVTETNLPLDRQIRSHLADHLTSTRVPTHLRICQCREHRCAWHRLQVPCSGPLRLLLAHADAGRTWRLADTCLGCASATPHAAAVPEPPQQTTAPTAALPYRSHEPMPETGAWIEAM